MEQGPKSFHAESSLGTLTRTGACWENASAIFEWPCGPTTVRIRSSSAYMPAIADFADEVRGLGAKVEAIAPPEDPAESREAYALTLFGMWGWLASGRTPIGTDPGHTSSSTTRVRG